MYKGISFYFGYDSNYAERATLIKTAGFDSVIASADRKFNYQNGSISQQVKFFKKNDLKPSSLHMRYNKEDLPHFFKDDKIGKKLEKNIKKDLKLAKKYGFSCVVVHLNGEVSFEGVERFKRILKCAEKLQVPIAIENLRDLRPFEYILTNFKSEFVGFCYDAGHHNAYNKDVDLLEKYGDRLLCLHLHDNDGERDLHTFNKFGTIDWQMLAKKLAKTKIEQLDYELLPKEKHGFSMQEALQECSKQALALEKMILEERKKTKNSYAKCRKEEKNR